MLKQVTDPRNLVTTYTYDGFGEPVKLASPDTGNTTSTYDAAGNLLTRIDARGVTATYTYDAINRVTQVVYSKSGIAERDARLHLRRRRQRQGPADPAHRYRRHHQLDLRGARPGERARRRSRAASPGP